MNSQATAISAFESLFPMVKVLEVEENRYVYDAKSGLLAEVSQQELGYICSYYFSHSNTHIPYYLEELLYKGAFLPGRLKRLTPNKKELEGIINFQMNHTIPRTLIVEVTENCNLCCGYCFFAKEDGFKNRKHKRKNIEESTAYKAIDSCYQKYTNAIKQLPQKNRSIAIKQSPPMLQWWGGEPFLAFNIITNTKIYFESLDWEHYGIAKEDIIYALTANLTVFNEDILIFLVQNNIKLRVSLDGNKDAHNKNRLFSDGRGTFDTVIKNLNTIIDNYPDYAKNNVGFQTVLADNISVFEAQDFIEKTFKLNTPLNLVLTCSISPQREEGRFLSQFEFTEGSIDEAILSFKEKLDRISLEKSESLENLLGYNKKLYQELKNVLMVEDLLSLNFSQGTDSISRLFSCPLGADTIFIASDGSMHCCAKTDYSFSFGHINTGINKDELIEIYTTYHNEIEKQCNSCWAFRFCHICPALVCYDKKFYLPRKNECDQIKKNAHIRLIQYILLTEKYEHLSHQIKSFQKKQLEPESKLIN